MPEPDQPPNNSSLAPQTASTTSPTNQSVHQEHWPLKRIPFQPALSSPFLASILLIDVALIAIAQFLVFREPNRWAPWFVAVYQATKGLIDFTLMLGLALQVLNIGILLIGIGRLRPRELGLDIAKVPVGVAWTFAAWLAAQLVTLLVCVVAGEPIVLNPEWSFGSWTQPAGKWIAQLFGNAAFEEVLYRGFLFPQCVWLASSWFRGRSDRSRIAIALLISQGCFALGHIPFNFVGGGWSGQWLLIFQFLMGLAFCGIYIRTGNLFLAIGFHALSNNPGPLLSGGTIAEILPIAIVHLFILALLLGRPKSLMGLFVRRDDSEQVTQLSKQADAGRISFLDMRNRSQPRGRRRRRIAVIAATAIAMVLAIVFLGALYPSMFIQSPWKAIPKATSEELAKLHDPDALRADLDAIIALHERTSPNPYLRVSKESISELAERLKASIRRPMTRREFLPLVMELQAGYRSDHYSMDFPSEDCEFALARGARMLPFRAEPKDDGLVVVAVAESERAIEPGDIIVRIGTLSAADHLARLRLLVPNESARYRDLEVRERFRKLALASGITLPTEIEFIRPDGSRHTAIVEGVGDGVRETERTAAISAATNKPDAPQGELLVERVPFRCLLLANNPADAPPIAYIEFPSMNSTLGDQWDTFLDQAMTAANARGAAGLIVDIRENGGGNSRLGDAFLARVNNRPYRLASRSVWRKSPDSDELFRSMVKPMWRWLFIALPLFIPDYTALRHGEDLINESKATSYPRVAPGFEGPTCLLIGERTFSSAMMFADGVRTYDLMLTIGQPTGGIPNALGDIGPFQLPNSRLVIPFSMKMFVRASGDESDVGPVRPHIEVAPVPGRDAALERAIEEIRRMQAEKKE